MKMFSILCFLLFQMFQCCCWWCFLFQKIFNNDLCQKHFSCGFPFSTIKIVLLFNFSPSKQHSQLRLKCDKLSEQMCFASLRPKLVNERWKTKADSRVFVENTFHYSYFKSFRFILCEFSFWSLLCFTCNDLKLTLCPLPRKNKKTVRELKFCFKNYYPLAQYFFSSLVCDILRKAGGKA